MLADLILNLIKVQKQLFQSRRTESYYNPIFNKEILKFNIKINNMVSKKIKKCKGNVKTATKYYFNIKRIRN
jgi:hypothetical protein